VRCFFFSRHIAAPLTQQCPAPSDLPGTDKSQRKKMAKEREENDEIANKIHNKEQHQQYTIPVIETDPTIYWQRYLT
jgi:hypothetical protein